MRVHWPGESDFPSPAAWDEFVNASPQGHLLQSWGWGELKGRFDWQPLRLAVSDNGRLVAAAQVLLRRLPYSSLAYVPRGPVFDPADEEATRTLLDALHQVARGRGAMALKVEPPWPDDDHAATWWQEHGFRPSPQTIQPRRTIVVDLQPDEEAILAQMKPKWRYNIRLAGRKEVTVRQGSAAELEQFYDLMRETGERDGFGIHSPAYYQAAYDLYSPSGRVALFLAEYEGEPLAALMAFAFGRQAIYMYGASSNRERQRMPNHLLQWEAMRWAKAQGCSDYDLWGIPDTDPNSPSASLGGVERFKAGFGGDTVRYAGAFDYVYSPLVYHAFNWLWGRRRAAARRAQPAGAGETADE
jgi:peptidoglycan pentaglycine glycine transferase (the first glycine)